MQLFLSSLKCKHSKDASAPPFATSGSLRLGTGLAVPELQKKVTRMLHSLQLYNSNSAATHSLQPAAPLDCVFEFKLTLIATCNYLRNYSHLLGAGVHNDDMKTVCQYEHGQS